MVRTRTRVAASMALIVPLALGLAGCSGSEGGTESPAATDPGPEETPEPEVEPEPTEEPGDASADQSENLDAFVAEAETYIEDLMEASGGVYSDLRISAEHPGTVHYEYVFAEELPAEDAAEQFDSMVPMFQEECDAAVFPEMVDAGITVDPRVRYTYYNPDGTQIWSNLFSPSA